MILTWQQEIHQLECIDRWRNDILQDLNHGQLTELLLHWEVVSTFQYKLGEHWLPVNWYYHLCILAPLWNEGWVFETCLPVVSQSPILGYELKEFLAWGPGNRTVKLDIDHYAALDTASGIVSEPHSCKGKNPVVCTQGIVWHDGCASAVVVQHGIHTTC